MGSWVVISESWYNLEALRINCDYSGSTSGVITLGAALLDDTTERVNITLPRRFLKRLDALARTAGESRSGYIARLSLEGRREAAWGCTGSFICIRLRYPVHGVQFRGARVKIS